MRPSRKEHCHGAAVCRCIGAWLWFGKPANPAPEASAEVVEQGRCCRPSSLAMFTASSTFEGDRLPTQTMNMNPWDWNVIMFNRKFCPMVPRP